MKPLKAILKPVKTNTQLAKKHKVDEEEVVKQLEAGIKVEKEHTNNEKTAERIARAHIEEDLYYYEKLKKVETKKK